MASSAPAPAVETDDNPNPWSVLQELLKTVVALGSGLLGVSVTFALPVVGQASGGIRCALYAAWGLAVVAIGCAIVAHGSIINVLRQRGKEGQAVLLANSSFVALLASAIAFAVLGYLRTTERNLDAVAAVEKVHAVMPKMSNDPNAKWNLKSLTLDAAKNVFEIVVIKDQGTETYTLSVDANGAVVKVSGP